MNSSKHVSTHRMICWQIINRCNRSCSFCISRSSPDIPLSSTDRLKIINRFAELGTEKLSISGGEPFLLKELDRVVKTATDLGLEVQITTNGDILFRSIPDWISCIRPLVNLSFYGTSIQHADAMGPKHRNMLWLLACRLKDAGISVGANYILSDSSLGEVKAFLDQASQSKFDRVLFVVYMPVGNSADLDRPLLRTKKYTAKIQDAIEHLGVKFPQGVRIHDYRKENFFPVCDEYGRLFLAVPGIKSPSFMGSVYDQFLKIPDSSLLPIRNAFEEFWNRRLHTKHIVKL